MKTLIKEMPIDDRPRERLLRYGAEALNNEELLAIILKTGTKELSVKALALYLLKQVGDIKNLKYVTLEQLKEIKGIGNAKACEILAMIEIGKRVNREIVTLNDIKIKHSSMVYNYYKYILKDKKQEHFYCLYLDSSNKVIKSKLLFIGTINKSNVYPREIFKEAYLINASSIICIHNHPSNEINPSKEDIAITKTLKELGYLLGVNVLDHLIIGNNKYYSFLENGTL